MSMMSHLQTHYHFKLNFRKWTGMLEKKQLIHSTEHRKDNQLPPLQNIQEENLNMT